MATPLLELLGTMEGVGASDLFFTEGKPPAARVHGQIRVLDEPATDRVAMRELVEVRNQARVHLWFESKFGEPYTPLTHTAEALTRFVSSTFAVGVRLEADDRLGVVAPFGLDDLFALRMRPNPLRPTLGFARNAASVASRWPELRVEP